MLIGGVDLGVRKAAVCMIGDGHAGVDLHTVQAFASTAPTRSAQLREVADFVLTQTFGADVVYVEEAIVGRGVRTSLQIAQTVGAVLAALDLPTYLVSNTDWKKDTVGSGNAGKHLIAEWLDELHPCYSRCCDGDQDRVDATCIALYGRQQSLLAARLREGLDLSGA